VFKVLKFKDLDYLNGSRVRVSIKDCRDVFEGIVRTREGTKFSIIDDFQIYWDLDMIEVENIEEIQTKKQVDEVKRITRAIERAEESGDYMKASELTRELIELIQG
jgi:hypothetical protein